MKQSLVKVLVWIVAIAVGALFALSVFRSSAPSTAPTGTPGNPTAATSPATQAPAPGRMESPQAAPAPVTSAPAVAPATQSAAAPGNFHVEPVAQEKVAAIGSDQKSSPFNMKVDFTPYGSGVRSIRLARYNAAALSNEAYDLVTPIQSGPYTLFPLAARSVTINRGKPVDLQSVPWELLDNGTPGSVTYRLRILDEQNQPVLAIARTYTLEPNSYDLRCDQQLVNLSPGPLQVVWEQNAQGDVPLDDAAYMGDRRMLVVGYYNLDYDPTRKHIYTERTFLARTATLDAWADQQTPLWPNPHLTQKVELAWFAAVNRYFTTVTHPIVRPPSKPDGVWTPEPWFNPDQGAFAALGMEVLGHRDKNPANDTRRLVLTLTSKAIDLAPNQTRSLDLALYAGPRKKEVFEQTSLAALNFSKLIVYELGCTWCTFQPLAKGLLQFLKAIHFIARDWGVAIIVLVLLVRLVLHPITKRSQINMTKMGKQMGMLQPEIEKLKKKYKDDQQTLNAEMMKLYREKGVNPANMLGCLPMVLQMPIWVALYAMLYFAIELRHQPAFYGIFQAISGGHWAFLADLSSADNFIRIFKEPQQINLFLIHPNFQAINLLPILMAVVSFYQQKLMAVPPANEQAAQQQKMMKWMVLLIPVMLYSAPSGLNLYILASTGAGIIDSLVVRRHIKREEEAGTLFKKKEVKPGGWRERLQKAFESKQRELMNRQNQSGKGRSRRDDR